MPARHEFEGRICGTRFELVYFSDQNVPNEVECSSEECNNPDCIADISFDWGFLAMSGEQTFGVRYFVNPETGHKIVAGTSYAKAPHGYRVETTTSYREVQKLEKEINNQEMAFSGRNREAMAAEDEAHRKFMRENVISTEQLEREARAQEKIRTEMVNEMAESMGVTEIKRYQPKIEDPTKRAELGRHLERTYLDQQDQKADRYLAVDPGIHFAELHNSAPVGQRRPKISATKVK